MLRIRKFCEALLSFRAMLWLRLIFGYYSEISPSKLFCFGAALYCILFRIPILSYHAYILQSTCGYFKVLVSEVTIHFIVNMLISIYTKDRAILNFFSNIKTIDKVLGVKENFFNINITILFTWTCLIVKSIFYWCFNPSHTLSFWSATACFAALSNHLSRFPETVLFELMWSRLKFIVGRLKLQLNNKKLCAEDKIFILKKFLHIYKNLLDIFYRNNNSVKLVIFCNLIFSFLIQIICFSYGISEIINSGYTDMSINFISEAVINTIMASSVNILAEMILNEYDELKEMLGDLLIMHKDEDLRKMIYECLEYITTRPPRYTIWRIFSLNIHLSVGFIELCSTYVIILLQFQY